MGNQPTKHSGSSGRPKKAVHWKSAEPPSPPGKPMLVPGTPDSSAPDIVTLRWKRPTSDGGSPILGYIVEHRRTGSPHWVRATVVLIQATELSFSGLEPGWRYQFRVTAQNIVGQSDCSELSDALTVTLQRAAIAPPRFIYELNDTTAIENEKIEFRVSVAGTPAPQISWFKDGFEMFSSRRTKILSEGDFSVLIIHQAALTDEGEIKCTATNSAGSAVTICNLSIDAYPKIRLPRQYEDGLIIEADEVIRLKVGLAGQPTPIVEWSHNGEVLTNGGRYEIETSDKNSSLRISNAQRSDRGEYNLRAINKLGEDYASFLVTVTAKPEPPGKITVSMSLGKSVTLSWAEPEDDGGCKIGNYIVEYYRLGWDVWLKASTCRQLTTTLSGLIEGSQYRFRVKAENPYGLSEPSDISDTVFIPDPKRGINSATQIPETKDKEDKECQTPLAVPRKRREESRSPAREAEQVKKAKAFTPETYSRDEIVREMSYGARDEDFFKPKFQEPPKQPVVPSVVVTEPTAPEPTPAPPRSPQPQRPQSFASPLKAMEKFSKEPSPLAFRSSDNSLAPREATTPTLPDKPAIHNSSEFMLVLYNEREAKNTARNSTFDFDLEDMAAPPPPLSLSAPELNVEPPPAPAMRPAVSSTELLYERAMARFYQAVAMEESENQRKEAEQRRRSSYGGGGAEQQQQNGGQDAVARLTDRRSSLRRRLSGDKEAIVKQSSFESSDGRQHSSTVDSVIPEEKEEQGVERDEVRVEEEHSIVDEVLEELDEEGSMSGSMDSFMEELKRRESARSSRSRVMSDEEEEMETYHPRQRLVSPYRNPDPSQAIEVLTKPLPMPDPNFVPKPILKRPSTEILTRDEKDKKELEVKEIEVAVEKVEVPAVVQEPKEEKKAVPPSKPERKSLMTFLERKSPAKEEPPKPVEREKTPEIKQQDEIQAPLSEKQGPSEEEIKQAIVQEAARQKRRVSRQNSEEEAKAIANFYGEILERVESSKKPRKLPLYNNPDELRKLNSRETSYDRFARSRSGSASPMPPEDIYLAQKSRSPSLTSEQIVLKGKPARESKILRQRSASIETEPARPPSVAREVPVVPPTPPKPEQPPKLETAFIPSAYDEPVRKSRPLRESTAIAKKRNVSSTRSSRNSSATRDAESITDTLEAARRARLRSASKSPSALQRTSVTLTPPPPPTSVEPPKPPTPTPIPTPAKEAPKTPPEPRSRSQSQTREPPTDPQDDSLKYTLSYLTDVALFVFACWLYLFKNPKWAIPVIALIVYRQIKDAMRDRMPPWVRRSLGTDS